MKLYWYAPFNNANEVDVAEELAKRLDASDAFLFHSLERDFSGSTPEGPRLPTTRRDLPGPESGIRRRAILPFRRSFVRRASALSFAPDIAHVHTLNPLTDGLALRDLKRFMPSVIATVHNVWPHERRLPASVVRVLHKRMYEVPDRLIVAHEYLAQLLSEDFSIDRKTIDVVPLPIPTSVKPITAQPREPEQRPDALVRLLFFGTLRRGKGLKGALKALQHLPDARHLRLHVAGRGVSELENEVRCASSRDARISCEIGYVADERVRELFHEADVLLLPYTRFAAQSGVLRQAYATGTPVIASDIGALGAAIKEDETGWLFPSGDISALAELLSEIQPNDERHKLACRNAYEIAAARTPDLTAERLAKIYREQ